MTKRNSVSGLSGLAWSPSQNWPLTMRMKRRPLNSWLRKTDSWTSSGVSWRNSSGSVNSDVYSWSVRIRCCRSGPVDPWNPTVPRPSDGAPPGPGRAPVCQKAPAPAALRTKSPRSEA